MDSAAAENFIALITTYGLNVLGGIVLLVVGWMAANWIGRTVRNQLEKSQKVDATLRGFFSNLARYLVLALVGVAVLNQFGVQTTSLIAVFGAAGLAIGLALQGTLSDLAAGVMLLIFRPFNVGQYIEAGGQSGTVKELSLFTTELATPDNVQIILPNSSVWGSPVINYSHHTTRRVDWTIGISYDDDIGKAFEAVHRVVADEKRIRPEPKPMAVASELADSAVNITIRVWVDAPDYWDVKFDLTRAFKEEFDRSGLSIPFPQQDVHMIQKSA